MNIGYKQIIFILPFREADVSSTFLILCLFRTLMGAFIYFNKQIRFIIFFIVLISYW